MLKSLVVCIILLAACSPAAVQPENDSRSAPTALPPAWIESADVISLENVANIRYLGRLDSTGSPSTIFAHALSPDGTRLAGLDNEQLVTWDLVNGGVVYSTGRGDANQIFYSPDKTEIYTITPEGITSIYNADTGVPQNSLNLIDNFNGITVFDAENGWLAAGSLSGDVRVWDPLERQSLATIDAHQLQVTALAFSLDGERLATAGEEGTVKIWDWRNRQLIASLDDDRFAIALRFSPDSSQLAAGNRENTRLIHTADGSLARIIDTGPGGIDALTYSPDGQYLVSGGAVPDMSIWDPQTGNLIARLPGVGGDRVWAVFSPDSTLLATSLLGGRPALWNMTTISGQTVNRADLDTQGNLILNIDWTYDNRLLVLFGVTNGVYIWGIGPAATETS
jgi:WD40 repeat protein